MIEQLLKKVAAKQDLTYDEAKTAVDEIMSGNVSQVVTSAFLTALAMKGETDDEIAGAAEGMRSKAVPFELGCHALDVVGTGGDGSNSFNISTTAGLVAAAAGVTIAKHGNRAASSKSGTADCLEALGVKIDCEPEVMRKSLNENKIVFFFAQKYHSAMRFVGPVRKEIGIRTVFNILGPLTNPGHADRMLLGVFSEEYVEKIAKALIKLGVHDAMVVYGMDKLDEISACGETKVAEAFDYPYTYQYLLTNLKDQQQVANIMSRFGELKVEKTHDRAGNEVNWIRFIEFELMDMLYLYKDRSDK